jgi:predicted dehydrogenase
VHAGCAEVDSLAEPQAILRDRAKSIAPGAAEVATFHDLLGRNADGIVIATPSAMHTTQCVDALELGYSVFCKKPLGRTAGEARRVVDAARAANQLLCVDFGYRNATAVRRVRELAKSGELGHVRVARLAFHDAYGPGKACDRALSGGGCLMDLGSHLVDLALFVLGFPEVLGVECRTLRLGSHVATSAVEDVAVARLDLEGDAIVEIACSWGLPIGRGVEIRAEFFGSRGGAAIRNVGGSFHDLVAERYAGDSTTTLAIPPDDWGSRGIVDWANRVAKREGFSEEANEHVVVAELLDRLYDAASGEGPIR